MFGLLGRQLGHSFSRTYFTAKFEALGLDDHVYQNFELADASEFPALLTKEPALAGLNVTMPYKSAVVEYLDEVRGAAAEIGAVNTIVRRGGRLIGYNTDVLGLDATLEPHLPALLEAGHEAVVLGNGGAAAAVKWVLAKAGLAYRVYTRRPERYDDALDSSDLANLSLARPRLYVNATPVGTFPDIECAPPLPLALVQNGDVVVDLIYNPPETKLLREAKRRGAKTANGLVMLHAQAEAAWRLWNSDTLPT